MDDLIKNMDQVPISQTTRVPNSARMSQASVKVDEVQSPSFLAPQEETKSQQASAMDVINKLACSGKQSKFMQGHVDKDLLDHTFMVTADQKVPDSTLAINCEDHNRPAVFFSQKMNSWRCFLCMMSQEGLVYVDKQYKHDMEEYEGIKALTYRAVVENTPAMTLIAEWKKNIRSTLVQVRREFNEWIDTFTHKFVRSLNKIESSKEMMEFAENDR